MRENVDTGDEQRLEAIRVTLDLMLLRVIFVDRSIPGVEIIRIITARKAERYERAIYEEQLR